VSDQPAFIVRTPYINRCYTYKDLSDLLRPLSTCVDVRVGSTRVVDGCLKDFEQVGRDSCHSYGGVDVSESWSRSRTEVLYPAGM
jgi:hypothetical protein